MKLSNIKTLTILSLLVATLAVASADWGECGSEHGGALCQEGFCCSIHGYCGNTNDYCGPGNCQSQCPDPSPPPPPPPPFTPPPPVSPDDISNIITEKLYDEMFPNRFYSTCTGQAAFTYDGFISAARMFPEFGTSGTPEIRRRELAAFLGQTSHETTGGWDGAPGGRFLWGYCFVRELNEGLYCDPNSVQWPCVPGQKYFGRGAIQLSWNYNYGQAGEYFGLPLLSNADMVATDPKLVFATAIWFWMTPQGKKPSCHDVITGEWTPTDEDKAANRVPGYGMLINIINGGLECNVPSPNPNVEDRIGFYKRYCDMLGVSPGDNLDCYDQKPFYSVNFAHHPRSSYGVLKMPVDQA